MKAGRLTEEVRIERASNTLNEYGTPITTWVTLCTLRAERVEQSTTEYIRNYGASDEDVVVLRARFFEGITNADRLIWHGQSYNINQTVPIGRRQGVELRCVRMDP
ncbi:phage head closure protein [Paracoccus sp. Z330]|uniref:Phage head closure protein n=1 Tax=Paracoccus onchidii TaxID=3017813 RepID=A0ABT4ZK30_9RHOB|nr:phage head closure protein [Paracoccus onchidii]MDB6179554.1 phage head closure protein [Paracoccus onchidii]